MPIANNWYLVSSRGAVLFYIALHPECTIAEIADAMSLTRRSIWGIVGDLRRASMVHVRRRGRRHHYRVNLDASFSHPLLDSIPLRVILGELVSRYGRRSPQERVGD